MEQILSKYTDLAKEFNKKANVLWNKVSFLTVAESVNGEVDLRELDKLCYAIQTDAYNKKRELTNSFDKLSEDEYEKWDRAVMDVEDLYYKLDNKFNAISEAIDALKDLADKFEENNYLELFSDITPIDIKANESLRAFTFESFIDEQNKVPYFSNSGYYRPSEYKNLKLGKNTRIEQILKFIYDGGEAGRSWKEIHKFIVEDIKGLKQDISNKDDGESNRGYYSSFFTNVLPHFASKYGRTGRWKIDDEVLLAYFSKDHKKIEAATVNSLDDIYSKIEGLGLHNDDPQIIRLKLKLLKNKNLSGSLLLKLANDSNTEVSHAAKHHEQIKKLFPGVDTGSLYRLGIF